MATVGSRREHRARTTTDEASAVAERYATAWIGNDLDGLLGCYSDDFTLHYFGDHPFAGDHVGRDAALAALLEVGARAPRRLIAVDDVLAGPGAAALVVREGIEVDGEVVEIGRVLRYRVEGDRFAECWLHEEQQALIDSAWSDR